MPLAAVCRPRRVRTRVRGRDLGCDGALQPGGRPVLDGKHHHGLGRANWWDSGYTGKGVDIALIDTGVSPVEGLNTPGKIVYGPDLSLESQSPALRNLDTNGHGTFMAGLIAGRDSTVTAPYSAAPASAYRGMAPDARIISLKVATADGGADVSQVIAAIDWVVQHAHDPGFNIRVINLSYGTNSKQSYGVDPLAYAAEQAWKKGIVVVAAAGQHRLPARQRGTGPRQSGVRPVHHRRRRLRLHGNGQLQRRQDRRLLGQFCRLRCDVQEPGLRRGRLAPAGAPRSR